jgi:hypothetical protein
MKRSFPIVFILALFLATILPAPIHGQGGPQPGSPQVEVSWAVQHDVSPPLRDRPSAPRSDVPREHPLRPIPANVAAHEQADPVLQTTSGLLISTTTGVSFPGVGAGDYGFAPNAAPPDTNLAVGAAQVVQWVNESFAVFNKTTGSIAPGFPKAGNTLWSGFGGGCETNNDGDPIAQYDKLANRWVLTQFSVSTTPYLQCVAVSTTSDATGSYARYAFSYGNTQFIDYSKLGVWPDGYYVTYNIFNNGTTFAGAKLCALNRSAMLAGTAAIQECFQLSSSFGGVLPSDFDGDSKTEPPTGSPDYMLNFGANSLNEWKFHSDFTTPANATLTGPFNIPVAPFNEACGGGSCITQPGTHTTLDSLGDRLMYRLAYRNFGTSESLVVNHSVQVSGSKRSQVAGVRWYELRNPNGNTGATLYQQGTFSPDSTSRWMGSIAMDKVGNIAVGYSASSSSVFPSIRYTGRLATDTLGTLGTENIVKAGSGSQNGNLHRWGDYSSLSIDPSDNCTFFYTNQYEKSTGSFNWSTEIASFKFATCQ